jgi:hypothetical protein
MSIKCVISEDLLEVFIQELGEEGFNDLQKQILALLKDASPELSFSYKDPTTDLDVHLDEERLDELCENILDYIFNVFVAAEVESDAALYHVLSRVKSENDLTLVLELVGENVNTDIVVQDPAGFTTQKVH